MQAGALRTLTTLQIAPLACIAVSVVHLAVTDLAPVGLRAADVVWTIALGIVAGLAMSRSPQWLVALAAFSTLGFVHSALGAVFGTVALLLALTSARRSTWSESIEDAAQSYGRSGMLLNAALCACLFSATLQFHDHGVPFTSAIAAGAIWVALIGGSWMTLAKPKRRRVALLFGATSIAGAIAVAGTAFELRDAYGDVRSAEGEIKEGLRAAKSGEFDEAKASVALASSSVISAQEALSSPLVVAFRHAPIAGPNLRTAREVLASTSKVIDSGNDAVSTAFKAENLLSDGGIDLDEVELLASNADALLRDAQDLRSTLLQERSTWIASPLESRLQEAAEQTTSLEELADLPIAQATRSMLGGDDQRSYLVLLGNTAEARELGGFAGGTALLTIDDGAVSLVRADRPGALNDHPTDPSVFTNIPPQRFLEHRPWLFSQNYTAMIDFPTLASSLGDLYADMGGRDVDGVAYIDPIALAAVLGLVGEVHLEEADMTVDAKSIARLINVGQYKQFDLDDEREEFLSELIATTFDAVLDAGADLDTEKLPALIRAIEQDRLLFVPLDDDEFTLMQSLGLSGSVAQSDGTDYLAVSHLNGGPNKLDAYLHREVEYKANVDPITGELDATVEITLRNDAPAGLSDFAAGNRFDYPHGTNRAYVVVHTPHDAVEWVGGDEPALTRSWREFGFQRHEQVVAVPRGESRTVLLRLKGSVAPGEYNLEIGHQPLVNTDSLSLHVRPTTGRYDPQGQFETRGGRDLHAELELKADVQLTANWTPLANPLPARAVGGESS